MPFIVNSSSPTPRCTTFLPRSSASPREAGNDFPNLFKLIATSWVVNVPKGPRKHVPPSSCVHGQLTHCVSKSKGQTNQNNGNIPDPEFTWSPPRGQGWWPPPPAQAPFYSSSSALFPWSSLVALHMEGHTSVIIARSWPACPRHGQRWSLSPSPPLWRLLALWSSWIATRPWILHGFLNPEARIARELDTPLLIGTLVGPGHILLVAPSEMLSLLLPFVHAKGRPLQPGWLRGLLLLLLLCRYARR